MANIIILNGTSSSGKSTLAKALQAQFDVPYLHSGIDNYIFMLPKRYLNPPHWQEIFRYEYSDQQTITAIRTGQFGEQLISAMHHAVCAIADAGFNVIVDHVLLERHWLDEIVTLFAEHTVWFIGVYCPLDILEQREKDRKDRTLGQARAQFHIVHIHAEYDLQLDASLSTPEEMAVSIEQHVKTHAKPHIFPSLR